MRHLIDPTDLSMQELNEIIALAEDIIEKGTEFIYKSQD